MALGNFSVIGPKNTDPHAVFDDLEIRPDDVFAKTQGVWTRCAGKAAARFRPICARC